MTVHLLEFKDIVQNILISFNLLVTIPAIKIVVKV